MDSQGSLVRQPNGTVRLCFFEERNHESKRGETREAQAVRLPLAAE